MAWEIKTRRLRSQPVVAIRAHTSPAKVEDVAGVLVAQVSEWLEEAGERPEGPAVVRFFDFRDDHVDMEAGLPVDRILDPPRPLHATELPSCQAATAIHEGSYSAVAGLHDVVGRWVMDNKQDVKGAAWERWHTDPTVESDTRATEVVWPLR